MESLEYIYEVHKPFIPYLMAGSAGMITLLMVKNILFRRKTGPGSIEAPPNTAIIYQIERGPFAPSLSPFPIKLETYCRLAQIPYVLSERRNLTYISLRIKNKKNVDSTSRHSSRGKFPWLTYNGETVEDSQFCIEYFNKKLGVDLNRDLSVEERAVARFIQVLVDEHLYWTEGLMRFVYYSKDTRKRMGWPWLVSHMVQKLISTQAHAQGIGRHSLVEVKAIMMGDLKSLSDFLGEKPYMLGNEMCEADCSVFGLLAQFEWQPFNEIMTDLLKEKFPNLHRYCHRIKDKLWPDWEKCCQN